MKCKIKGMLVVYDNGDVVYMCPGCDTPHRINKAWTFNGDYDKPSFIPSILSTRPGHRCHSFITDGKIRFLGNCTHALANQRVDMIDPKEWASEYGYTYL